MVRGKGKGESFGKTALCYLKEIAAERLIPAELKDDDILLAAYIDETSKSSKPMRIGTEREADARSMYELLTGNKVELTGSVQHPRLAGFASSPDGLIKGGQGALELKCPTPKVHTQYLAEVRTAEDLKEFNPTYYWQTIAHMSVTGARWCDFATYCPWSELPMRLVVIERDEEEVAYLESRVEEGLAWIESYLGRIKN